LKTAVDGGKPCAVRKARNAALFGAKIVRLGPIGRFNTESSLFRPVCPESALVMAALRKVRVVSALIRADNVCEGGETSPATLWITPLEAWMSACVTGILFTHACVPLLDGKLDNLTKGAGEPGGENKVNACRFGKASGIAAAGTFPPSTWYWINGCKVLTGSELITAMLGIPDALKAALLGAKTVKFKV